MAGVDFNFNGWGDKQRHGADSRLAKTMCDGLDIDHLRSDLVGEGGGIETDGLGTAIMTESSWLNDNRNPRWTKAEIEQALAHDLGFRKIIWLPGIKGRDITDAHVDFYARFARPGVVVANLDMDPDSYDYELTRKHLDILMRSTDADGKPLTSTPCRRRRTRAAAASCATTPISPPATSTTSSSTALSSRPSSATPRPTPMRANCWNGCIRGARWCS